MAGQYQVPEVFGTHTEAVDAIRDAPRIELCTKHLVRAFDLPGAPICPVGGDCEYKEYALVELEGEE